MTLKGDLDNLRETRPRTFDKWLEQAEPEDREQVLEAVNDKSLPANALAVLLSTRHGIPITRETIVRHRDAR